MKKKSLKKKSTDHNAISWLWLSALIIVIDQASKYIVNKHLILYEPVGLLPFLNFTLNYNQGAAFSFLGSAGGWQIYLLSTVSLAVSIIIFIWLIRVKNPHWLLSLSLSLILGGSLGNLIDRVRHAYVIDFIDFHLKNWHFAIFNVADSAISIGATLLVIKLLFFSRSEK